MNCTINIQQTNLKVNPLQAKAVYSNHMVKEKGTCIQKAMPLKLYHCVIVVDGF